MLNANTYITSEKGIGGSIRTKYEDFYVEEIPDMIPQGEGPNIWIWIEKVGRTTLDVLMDISRDLKIDRRRMGFAGMKDKKAVTRQWICISNMESEEDFEKVKALEGTIYKVTFLEIIRGRKKLRMGQLVGNKFKLIIRGIEEESSTTLKNAKSTAETILKTLEKTGVPNYYGWQRFGKPRTNTHIVGKFLVENDLAGAVKAYIGDPDPNENENVRIARQAYNDGYAEKSYDLMPSGMRYERMMLREIIKAIKKSKSNNNETDKTIISSNDNDNGDNDNTGVDTHNHDNNINPYDKTSINNIDTNYDSENYEFSDLNSLDDKVYKRAIAALPKPLQRMFVHAYQSYLFNLATSNRTKLGINNYIEGDIVIDNEEHIVREKSPEEIQEMFDKFEAHPTAPLYGSKVPFAEGIVGKQEKAVLEEEGRTLEDFKCPKTPKLGSHGIRRSIRFKVWDTSVTITEEGLLAEFSIPKGCYATAVLREIMKNEVV
ncbi:MAG: tRNA pseudouridine(13) synthase TruD [Methanobacteriaceae archaeon]